MASVPTLYLTRDRYLELDSRAERPSEFIDGEMFPIEAASPRHAIISYNLVRTIGQRLLRNERCQGMNSSIRVHIPGGRDTYPDFVVACGKQEYRDGKYETLLNPTVLFEVLSPATMNYDLGLKSELYCTIPSLAEYITIEQSRPKVRRILRLPSNKWLIEQFSGLDAVVPLEAIDCQLPLSELYERIEFDPAPEEV